MKIVQGGFCLVGMLILAACKAPTPEHTSSENTAAQRRAFIAEQERWRAQRREHLLTPDGWTSLIGLYRLQAPVYELGRGADRDIRLALGPERLGRVNDQQGRIHFTPAPGVPVTFNGKPITGTVVLTNDRDDAPSLIGFDGGKGQLSVIERGHWQALRIKHADAPSRVHFTGLHYWPADIDWKIQARYLAHPPGKTLNIADVTGGTVQAPNPGAVEFERHGQRYRLEALGEPDGGLFFVLADRSNGHGSYPAGRFLDATAAVDGHVWLDFNQAYNPPCAFTAFATCPLPPPENRLDVVIDAGEQTYQTATSAQ